MPHKHGLPDSGPSESLFDGAILDGKILNNEGITDLLSSVNRGKFASLFTKGFFG